MGSIESNGSGQGRIIISIDTIRALGASRDPDKIEALVRMPLSSLEVLSRFRCPPIEDIPNDPDPLPPAA